MAMADRGGFQMQEVITYAYLLLYIALSSGQVFFNKRVLSSKEINFPYPLGLTLLPMVFSSVLCFLLTKIFKVMKVEEGMTVDVYITSVIPIGAMFAMTLWLGNTAYLYISVVFAQMLKATMPVAVFVLGVAAGLEVMSCRMVLTMSVISLGVLVASYVGNKHQLDWSCLSDGWCYWRSFEAYFHGDFWEEERSQAQPYIYDVLCEPLQGCTPLDSATCLFVPWIFLEKPKLGDDGTWNFRPVILMLNSLCMFALNVSVFLVIMHTSALAIRVAGVVKDWVVVLVSTLLFVDTKLTMINLVGYGIAIAGVAAYNNHKLEKEASGSGPSNEQQDQSVQLTSTSASDK